MGARAAGRHAKGPGSRNSANQGPSTLSRNLLGGHHVHRERRGHLGVQLDLDVVRARGLDVPRQLEPATVERRTAGGLDRVDDLGRRDRAEQPAAVAGPRRQRDLEAGQLGLDLVGLAQVADLAGLAGPLDDDDLLLGALAPLDREALRQQVVAAVAVLDLDDVAGGAETRHLLGEDDLHVPDPPQRAVAVYGRSAISRAFLTARAICRCCCEVTPVTRRARILPRSEMNFRSSAVSL